MPEVAGIQCVGFQSVRSLDSLRSSFLAFYLSKSFVSDFRLATERGHFKSGCCENWAWDLLESGTATKRSFILLKLAGAYEVSTKWRVKGSIRPFIVVGKSFDFFALQQIVLRMRKGNLKNKISINRIANTTIRPRAKPGSIIASQLTNATSFDLAELI